MASFQSHISKGGKTKFLDFFLHRASAKKKVCKAKNFHVLVPQDQKVKNKGAAPLSRGSNLKEIVRAKFPVFDSTVNAT